MVMKLLNAVSGRKRAAQAAPPPPVPKRPPLPGKLLGELVGLEAMRNRRLDDRRRRPRLELHRRIVIDADLQPSQQTFDAIVRYMSAEGISMEVPAALAAGIRFRTTMPLVSADGLVALTYVVRRCEQQPDGHHIIGSELFEYLD